MPLFGYPGGKVRLHGTIEPFICEYTYNSQGLEYREPFAGSLGLLLRMGYEASFHDIFRIWINDLDPSIASLWTGVIRYPKELEERILGFTPSVDAFLTFKKDSFQLESLPSSKDLLVECAFKKLALHKMSFNSPMHDIRGGLKQQGKTLVDRNWRPQLLCSTLWQWHRRLSRFQPRENRCSGYDFTTLIADDSCPAVLYLDPPYFNIERYYRFSFSERDHVRLSQALKATPHRWVLSYNDCPEVRDLYSWARVYTFPHTYRLTSGIAGAACRHEGVRANELVIVRNKP